MNKDEFYKTTDICLAATLCVLYFKIELIEKISHSKSVFVFRNSAELSSITKSFFNHELKVEPLGFFNSLKEIKTRIYNA